MTPTGVFAVSLPIDGEAATIGNGSTVGFNCASAEQADAWHAAGVAAGPVPWIHWRCRSGGISSPMNLPSRASCTRMSVPGMRAFGSRKPMGLRSLMRAFLRSIRSAINRCCSSLNPAMKASAASTSGV